MNKIIRLREAWPSINQPILSEIPYHPPPTPPRTEEKQCNSLHRPAFVCSLHPLMMQIMENLPNPETISSSPIRPQRPIGGEHGRT
jgi:hypothetical protein